MKVSKTSIKFSAFIIISLSLLFWQKQPVFAQSCDEQHNCEKYQDDEEKKDKYTSCLNDLKACWEGKISQAKTQANTLQSTINILNGQIQLQAIKIQQTSNEIQQLEKEITELTQRIEGLSISLDKLSGILIEKVRASYKQSRTQFKINLFANDSFNDFVSQYRYLNIAQEQTLEVMRRTELQRATYDQQKTLKEEKQAEVNAKKIDLEQQKAELDAQKSAKNNLLAETKNNEAVYQQKLATIMSELEAINAIIAGKGSESLVKTVKRGDTIASIIQGTSCNSKGTHLHFMITKGSVSQNPFNYLKKIDYKNCSGSSCGSESSDPFNPSGSWPWPIKGPVTLTQGYGYTWAVKNTWVSRIYSFHNGIDIVPTNSSSVKAVKDGELYRGSYTGQGGCRLPYVKVKHEGSVDSLYLHVNYY